MKVQRRVFFLYSSPPLQVENLSGEAFRDDIKDMKLKLMYEFGISSRGEGDFFQVCKRIYAPEKVTVKHMRKKYGRGSRKLATNSMNQYSLKKTFRPQGANIRHQSMGE